MVRLASIGDNNVDVYRNLNLVYPGGDCPNVAAFWAKSGQPSAYVGRFGNDRLGDLQYNSLQSLGVDLSGVRRYDEPTAWGSIDLIDGDRIFGEANVAINERHPIEAAEIAALQDGRYDLIHSSQYSFFAPGAFEQFGEGETPVSFDFTSEWTDDILRGRCPYLDYVFLSCSHLGERETGELLQRLVGEYGVKLAAGTRGMEGSWLFDGHTLFFQEAFPCQTVDTLGAGDAFLTRFLLCYTAGKKEMKELLRAFPQGGPSGEALYSCEEKLIRHSLAQASLFAARCCQENGAFGLAIPYQG